MRYVPTHLQTSQQNYSERNTCDLLLAMLELMSPKRFDLTQIPGAKTSSLSRRRYALWKKTTVDRLRILSAKLPSLSHAVSMAPTKSAIRCLCAWPSSVLWSCQHIYFASLSRGRVSPGPREFATSRASDPGLLGSCISWLRSSRLHARRNNTPG